MCTSDIRSAVNWYPQSTLDLNLSRQKLTLYWHLGWHSIYTQLAISRVLINSYEHHINQHLMACMWKFILKLSTNWRLRCWSSLDRVSMGILIECWSRCQCLDHIWLKYALSEFARYRGLIVSSPNSDPWSGPYIVLWVMTLNSNPATQPWFHEPVNQFSTCLLLILLTTLPASSSGSEGLGTL